VLGLVVRFRGIDRHSADWIARSLRRRLRLLSDKGPGIGEKLLSASIAAEEVGLPLVVHLGFSRQRIDRHAAYGVS
jgi:hypothetical protein